MVMAIKGTVTLPESEEEVAPLTVLSGDKPQANKEVLGRVASIE